MADISPPPALSVASSEQTRTIVIIVYGLYLGMLLCFGLSGIIGVILAYVKRDDARGTVWESHFENAIQLFWIGLGLGVLGVVTSLLVIGIFILFAAYIYVAYRTIKGLVAAIDSKPCVR